MSPSWEEEFASLLDLRDSGTGQVPRSPPSPRVSGVLGAEDAVTRLLEGAGSPTLPRRTGRFTLLRELGRGGMGVVFHAYDERLGRHVALKMLAPVFADSAEFRARFLREAAIAAQIEHPHLLRVYDEGEADGTLYFTMELVPGAASVATLIEALAPLADQPITGKALEILDRVGVPKAHLDPNAPPPPASVVFGRRVAALFAEAAEGLAALHARGVIHRDIKPSNLLFHPERGVCLADFGLARWEGSTLTASTAHLGSPGYMSPEQARGGGGGTTPASDIFSLGLTVFEVLDGRAAIEAPNLEGLLLAAINGTHRAPPARRRSLPEGLDRILLRCLALEPSDRYATADALRRDLESIAHGEIVSTRPISRLRIWTRRAARRWPWVVLACALAGLAGYWYANRPGVPALVSIDSFPDAEVLIDGGEVGRTPLSSYEVRPGRHVIAVRQPGFIRPNPIDEEISAGAVYRSRRFLLLSEPDSLIAFQHWVKALTTKESSLDLARVRGTRPADFTALLPRRDVSEPPQDLVFLVEGDARPTGSFFVRQVDADRDLWQTPVVGLASPEITTLPEDLRAHLVPGRYEWGFRDLSGTVRAKAEFAILEPGKARGLIYMVHQQVNRMNPEDPLLKTVEAQLLVNAGLYDRAIRTPAIWPYDLENKERPTSQPALHVLVAALDGLALSDTSLRLHHAAALLGR